MILGFLTKDTAQQQYGLTPDSTVFLDRRSHAYLGGVTEFLLAPMLTDAFQDLAAVVRKGGTILPEGGSVAPEHPAWVRFARAMMPMMLPAAQHIVQLVGAAAPDRPIKVLDIAAGHGIFGILLAQNNPHAQVVAQDWPNVLEVASENARAAGVGDRYRLLSGNAFDVDFGGGYDLVLLTNFLHHFDPPTCETLLRKVHAALADGGRALALEFVPNEDRISPAVPAAFSLMMLGTTPSGDAYTFGEFETMFQHAGFARCELHPLPATPEQAVVGFK